ncbi:MAG: AAA family ATPase [Eubacteriales bacterium]|nr:AAA family ATPase [Eubacteriales bacterium]
MKFLYFLSRCYRGEVTGFRLPMLSSNDETADGSFEDILFQGKKDSSRAVSFQFRLIPEEKDRRYLEAWVSGAEEFSAKELIYSISFSCHTPQKRIYLSALSIQAGETVIYQEQCSAGQEYSASSTLWSSTEENGVLPYLYTVQNTFFIEAMDRPFYPDSLSAEKHQNLYGPAQRFVLQYLQGAVQIVNGILREFAGNIEYLAPVRVSPRRSMLLSAEQELAVGAGGENTYHRLFAIETAGDGQAADKINEWLSLFGYHYKWNLVKPNYGEFLLRDLRSGYEVNIVDAGFGISQILPVIVAACENHSGLLAIDSPEAHLHDKMQGEIADLLIQTVRHRPVILETHSESILLRVQRRSLESGTPEEESAVIYFIRDEEDTSVCEKITFDRQGEFQGASEEFREFFAGDFYDAMKIEELKGLRMNV